MHINKTLMHGLIFLLITEHLLAVDPYAQFFKMSGIDVPQDVDLYNKMSTNNSNIDQNDIIGVVSSYSEKNDDLTSSERTLKALKDFTTLLSSTLNSTTHCTVSKPTIADDAHNPDYVSVNLSTDCKEKFSNINLPEGFYTNNVGDSLFIDDSLYNEDIIEEYIKNLKKYFHLETGFTNSKYIDLQNPIEIERNVEDSKSNKKFTKISFHGSYRGIQFRIPKNELINISSTPFVRYRFQIVPNELIDEIGKLPKSETNKIIANFIDRIQTKSIIFYNCISDRRVKNKSNLSVCMKDVELISMNIKSRAASPLIYDMVLNEMPNKGKKQIYATVNKTQYDSSFKKYTDCVQNISKRRFADTKELKNTILTDCKVPSFENFIKQ